MSRRRNSVSIVARGSELKPSRIIPRFYRAMIFSSPIDWAKFTADDYSWSHVFLQGYWEKDSYGRETHKHWPKGSKQEKLGREAAARILRSGKCSQEILNMLAALIDTPTDQYPAIKRQLVFVRRRESHPKQIGGHTNSMIAQYVHEGMKSGKRFKVAVHDATEKFHVSRAKVTRAYRLRPIIAAAEAELSELRSHKDANS